MMMFATILCRPDRSLLFGFAVSSLLFTYFSLLSRHSVGVSGQVYSLLSFSDESPSDLSNGRWPNGVIPFVLHPSVAPLLSLIMAAMSHIESHTCIRFQRLVPGAFTPDYVHIVVNSRGCFSRVGRSGGRQLLALSSGCFDIGSILHELCHTIGLHHEHMRWDRDAFLTIIWQNIRPDMLEQFRKIPRWQYSPFAGFNYNSIMIYSTRAFSYNGQVTMLPTVPGQRLSPSYRKTELAPTDIININAMYGCGIQ